MSTVSTLLILVSCIMITSSASSSKSKDKKRKSSGDAGDESSEYTTSTTIAPGNTSITATSRYNEALCDCFDIDLVCGPIEIEDQICYHYRIADISTASNCSDPITSITFGYGNLAECNLTVSDIEDTILDYAPSCYTLDTNDDESLIDGVTIVLDTETITYSVSDSSSSGSIVSGSSSDSSEVDDISIVASNFVLIGICFNASFVSGAQTNGTIQIDTDGNTAICEVPDILPDFCSASANAAAGAADGDDDSDHDPTTEPTIDPTVDPTADPTKDPTTDPTADPTIDPTTDPTADPTVDPTADPTIDPTIDPTVDPTSDPTADPTTDPTTDPTVDPTADPTTDPTADPTTDPTIDPTTDPTIDPTSDPTADPTVDPTTDPSKDPTTDPTSDPTSSPSGNPTMEPSVAPTFTVCTSNDSLNVAFLLDESGSVDEDEWDLATEFVDRIIQSDLTASSYVSLFEFATLANYEQFLDWTPVEDPIGSGDRSVFTDALEDNNYNVAGQTETWDAVNRVLDEFWDYRFSCTDGCDTRHDFLFLITDGEPTGQDVCPDMIERMNQTDVDIFIIFIDTAGDLDATLVSCLDVRDDEADVYEIGDFDDLNSIELAIREKICSNTLLPTESIRPDEGTQWTYNGTVGLGPVPTRSGGGQGGAADRAIVNDEGSDTNQHSAIADDDDSDDGFKFNIYIVAVIGLVVIVLIMAIFILIRKKLKNKGKHSFDTKQEAVPPATPSCVSPPLSTGVYNEENLNYAGIVREEMVEITEV